MKTLKIALVAAIVACTMVSLSYADGIHEKPNFKKVVNITYEKAIQNPGLLKAMYEQIDRDDLIVNPGQTYTAFVFYNGNVYRITGSRNQWLNFFKHEQVLPVDGRSVLKSN